MPKYKVTMRRSFEEFGEIEVEAEDEDEAKEIAQESADTDMAWSQQTLDEETVDSVEEVS